MNKQFLEDIKRYQNEIDIIDQQIIEQEEEQNWDLVDSLKEDMFAIEGSLVEFIRETNIVQEEDRVSNKVKRLPLNPDDNYFVNQQRDRMEQIHDDLTEIRQTSKKDLEIPF